MILRTKPQPYEVTGRLDLAHASGTLRLYPAVWVPAPRVGYLDIALWYWANSVRGSAFVEVAQVGNEDSLVRYRPLTGDFPTDGCPPWQRPFPPSEPSPLLFGSSPQDLRDELVTGLALVQPATATWWSNGEQTTISAELGSPFSACEVPNGMVYRIPLRLTSADGRVDIDRVARAAAQVDDTGAVDDAWLSIEDNNVYPPEEFSASSGISGLNLGSLTGARWSAILYPRRPPGVARQGHIRIESVVAPSPRGTVVEELTGPLE